MNKEAIESKCFCTSDMDGTNYYFKKKSAGYLMVRAVCTGQYEISSDVLYVSKESLQRSYPCSLSDFMEELNKAQETTMKELKE